jgi:hypothetical protein
VAVPGGHLLPRGGECEHAFSSSEPPDGLQNRSSDA